MASPDLLRGTLELLLLRSTFNRPAYGGELVEHLRRAGLASISDPSVYGALRRLEQGGCLTSDLRASTGGAARKYYSLTELGRDTLSTGVAEWKHLMQTFEAVHLWDQETSLK